MRKDYAETKTAKERLERMQAEKLFAFTEKLDADSFHILCAVLAQGDVAKARRALNACDATLRSRIRQWEEVFLQPRQLVASAAARLSPLGRAGAGPSGSQEAFRRARRSQAAGAARRSAPVSLARPCWPSSATAWMASSGL